MKTNAVIFGVVSPKKNSKRLIWAKGRTLFIPSKNYEAWRKDALLQLQASQFPEGLTQADLKMTFFFPDKRKRDLDGAVASVLDVMVEAGKLIDDNCFVVHRLELVFGGVCAKPDARVEIELL